MTINKFKFPTLARFVLPHEKRIERFQKDAAKYFHAYALKLCKRIQKGIPEFEGCTLFQRHLFLDPRDLKISMKRKFPTEFTDERLGNLMDYLPIDGDWIPVLPEDTIDALLELDELSNYIDDNYSNVSELHVKIKPKKS